MQLKTTFKIESLSLSIEDKPVELKGINLEFEVNAEKAEYLELCKATYEMFTTGGIETIAEKFAGVPPPVVKDYGFLGITE
jgi:hypothetical protein